MSVELSRRSVVLGATSHLLGCVEVPSSCASGLRHSVEVLILNGKPLVPIEIGGAPVLFVFDTGAWTTVLTANAPAVLGIKTIEGGRFGLDGVGGTNTAGAAVMEGGRLGGYMFPTRTVPVLPDGHWLQKMGVFGIIGMQGLENVEIDLNFPERRITLMPPTPCSGDSPGLRQQVWEVWAPPHSDMGLAQQDPRPHTKIKINGRPTVALLDTGADTSTIWRDALPRLGETIADPPGARVRHLGGVGSQEVREVVRRFGSLEFGGMRIDQPQIGVLERPDPGYAAGLLGMDILGNLRVWISLTRRRIFVSAEGGG